MNVTLMVSKCACKIASIVTDNSFAFTKHFSQKTENGTLKWQFETRMIFSHILLMKGNRLNKAVEVFIQDCNFSDQQAYELPRRLQLGKYAGIVCMYFTCSNIQYYCQSYNDSFESGTCCFKSDLGLPAFIEILWTVKQSIFHLQLCGLFYSWF